MARTRYCAPCDKRVIGVKKWSWTWFLVWTVLTIGWGIWVYPLYYFFKSRRCPNCGVRLRRFNASSVATAPLSRKQTATRWTQTTSESTEAAYSKPIIVDAGRPGLAAIVDLETTGFSPQNDQIIEISILIVEFDPQTGTPGQVIDEYHSLNEPSVPIHPMAQRVHNIHPSELAGKSLDLERIKSVLGDVDVVIAHNAPFDRSFMATILPACTNLAWRCSMAQVDWLARGFRDRRLHTLVRGHGLFDGQPHRARNDARYTLGILSQLDENGRPYFKELLTGRPFSPSVPSTGDKQRSRTLEELLGPGLIVAPRALDGKRVAVSGAMARWSREEVFELIELLGGEPKTSMSKKVDVLIVGPGAGSKRLKAEEFGTMILTEEEFITLIGRRSA